MILWKNFSESLDGVRTLLSSGVSPCIQDEQNRTAFQIASSEQIKAAFVQEFLQATAQSKFVFKFHQTSNDNSETFWLFLL